MSIKGSWVESKIIGMGVGVLVFIFLPSFGVTWYVNVLISLIASIISYAMMQKWMNTR